ncbi:MAG: hypothetical protein JXP34_20910 [Planctomycetes bacterium]|nr:hypothetical protein [Planctomycetota bacterium]
MREGSDAGFARRPIAGAGLIAFALAMGGLGAGLFAVDPRERPAGEPEEPPDAAPREVHGGSPAKDIEEIVKEIRERMGKSAALLSRYEVGDPLRREQEETVRLLEKLLENIQALQQQQSSSSCSQAQSSGSSPSDRSSEDQQRSKKRDDSLSKGEQRAGEEPRDGHEQTKNDEVSEKPLEPARAAGPLEDRVGRAKKWGDLPGSVIEEMLQSGRDGIPLKYAEILSRYYRRLSEVGSSQR